MRGGYAAQLGLLASFLGACVAPPSPPVRPRSVTPTVVPARADRAVILGSADRFAGGYRHLHATASGRLIAQSSLGLHQIDPRTGEELLLLPLPPRAIAVDVTYAGAFAIVRWDEPGYDDGTLDRPRLELLDLERGERRSLPAPAPRHALFSTDGARLAWRVSSGEGGVLDTATGRVLETLPATAAGADEPLRFSASGRYLLWGDQLRDLDAHRTIWQRPASTLPSQVWFTTTGGREALVTAERTRLTMTFADDATVRVADVDCVDRSSSYQEAVLPTLDVFVRICPRGAVYTDLRRLVDHVGVAALPPVRVKDARAYRAMPERLGLFLRPETSRFTAEGVRWMAYDPRSGRAEPATAAREIREAAGHYTIEVDDGGGCQLRGLGSPVSLSREGSGCAAALAHDAVWLATAANGTLTVSTLPGFQTRYAAGDSMARNHDSIDVRVDVEAEELVVHGTTYGDELLDNTLRIRRTSPAVATDFVAMPYDFTAPRDERARLRDIPLGWFGSCQQKGVIEHGTTRLVVCTRGSTERFYRLDEKTLALRGMHEGQRDGLSEAYGSQDNRDFLPEVRAGALPAVQIREHTSREILAHLHLGWDFAIAADGTGHVQVFGNRKRAATWLRCLDPDGRHLRPFEVCAAAVETTIY